jgi:uncharacterized alkaline shock family protein YloU
MTETISRGARGNRTGEDERSERARTRGTDVAPERRGRTTIADDVVEKIAGMAAREVPGVHSLGGGMSRALGSMRERVSGAGSGSVTRGVRVEVGERHAAVDLDVVVEYDVDIMRLAGEVRSTVISEVEGMTGLDTVEVNVAVDDVHLPDEEASSEGESRARVQ